MKKLLEMGFLEGSSIELLYESARKKQSALMAVRVRGGLVALRRSEAQSIEVELL
jgi:Fe2+ transport system protein FeoA